ncbi:MAG: hypothetical protein HQM10_05290 [Candidatus Riflebacteria bacterium]|nr:hypothetical protein [Candidatus Riflebacteria bacterium]
MRKFIVIHSLFAFVLGVSIFFQIFSISSVYAGSSAKEIASTINKAVENYQNYPELSESLFQKAFCDSLSLINPSNKSSVRELGFYLASRCLHPSLFTELPFISETYLKLFPKGAYRIQVLVNKALLDYACGRQIEGRAALELAEKYSGKAGKKQLLSLELHGLLSSGNFKSSGSLLDRLAKVSKGNTRFRRDRARYKKGSEEFKKVRKNLQKNSSDNESVIRELRDQLEKNYFAPDAPESALLLMTKEDSLSPRINGVEVRLFDLTRINSNYLHALQRISRLEALLRNYPEAEPEIAGKAVIQLHLTYLVEMNDPVRSGFWLEKLSKIPGYSERYRIEKALAVLLNSELGTNVLEQLKTLCDLKKYFPYDNGYLPRIEYSNAVSWFLSASLMDKADPALNAKIKDLPSDNSDKFLFFLANNSKTDALKEFESIKPTLENSEIALVESLLFPVYEQNDEGKRLLTIATLLARKFPKQAVDILVKVIEPVPVKLYYQHAFALLAEIYKSQGNVAEAQNVWSKLRKYFPGSCWLK